MPTSSGKFKAQLVSVVSGSAATFVAFSTFFPVQSLGITPEQAMNAWLQRPDWARAECNLLRSWNRKYRTSVLSDHFLTTMSSGYQMSARDTMVAVNWLVGNYCPDVF